MHFKLLRFFCSGQDTKTDWQLTPAAKSEEESISLSLSLSLVEVHQVEGEQDWTPPSWCSSPLTQGFPLLRRPLAPPCRVQKLLHGLVTWPGSRTPPPLTLIPVSIDLCTVRRDGAPDFQRIYVPIFGIMTILKKSGAPGFSSGAHFLQGWLAQGHISQKKRKWSKSGALRFSRAWVAYISNGGNV